MGNRIVRESLRKKLMASDYYKGFDEATTTKEITSYEEAMRKGDVTTMLRHKLGIVDAQERQERIDSFIASYDISKVVSELGIIGGQIERKQKAVEERIEARRAEIESEYKDSLRDYYSMGGLRGGYRELLMEDEYIKKIKNIEVEDDIKVMSIMVKDLQEREELLRAAKADYVGKNKEEIEAERKRRLSSEISAILDELEED